MPRQAQQPVQAPQPVQPVAAQPSALGLPGVPTPQPQPQISPQPSPQGPGGHRKLILISLIILVVFVASGAVYWVTSRPVCGNGVVEEGETIETCCEDAGCSGDASCQAAGCLDPFCGTCQYLQDHVCLDYECCADSDCTDTQECTANSCVGIVCGTCEYISNNTCVAWECCQNTDCSTGEECANNVCVSSCGTCQYRSNGACLDFECCTDDACSGDESCDQNNCVPVVCDTGELVINHSCIDAEPCTDSSDCDDNVATTLDLCTGALRCVHLTTDQCDDDGDCDDNNTITDDQCVGTPKHCTYTPEDCADVGGEICLSSQGLCDESLATAKDTAFCCLGTCNVNIDLFIDDLDESQGVLEVEIGGLTTVNDTEYFTIYAFEEGTRMDTTDGEQFVTLNGMNQTDTFFFNITMTGSLNLTAVVDYDDDINETNETNNEMTIIQSV